MGILEARAPRPGMGEDWAGWPVRPLTGGPVA